MGILCLPFVLRNTPVTIQNCFHIVAFRCCLYQREEPSFDNIVLHTLIITTVVNMNGFLCTENGWSEMTMCLCLGATVAFCVHLT